MEFIFPANQDRAVLLIKESEKSSTYFTLSHAYVTRECEKFTAFPFGTAYPSLPTFFFTSYLKFPVKPWVFHHPKSDPSIIHTDHNQ